MVKFYFPFTLTDPGVQGQWLKTQSSRGFSRLSFDGMFCSLTL